MTYRDDLRDSMREWVIDLGYNPLRQPGDDLLPDQAKPNDPWGTCSGCGQPGTVMTPLVGGQHRLCASIHRAPEPEWPADLPPRVRALVRAMEARA